MFVEFVIHRKFELIRSEHHMWHFLKMSNAADMLGGGGGGGSPYTCPKIMIA